jgi:hypothetical protein
LQAGEEVEIGANNTTEVNKPTLKLSPYRLISLGHDTNSQESFTGRRNLPLITNGYWGTGEVDAKVGQVFAPKSDINTRIRGLAGLHTLILVFSR